MGKTLHEKSYVDYDHPYERNLIGLRGIIYFAIGLFLLIVITFGLMYFLLNVMSEQALQADEASRNPMALTDKEQLPPEPRLQAAPGFGVDSPDGRRVNLELMHPQAEWEVLQEQYREIWEKGQKAPDGTIVALPIDQAKQRLLQENLKSSANAEQGKKLVEESMTFYSDASSGRVATDRRR